MLLPLRVQPGDPLTTWNIYLNKSSTSATTLTGQLVETDPAAGTNTTVGGAQVNASNNPGLVTMFGSAPGLVAGVGKSYVLALSLSGTAANDAVYGYRTVN
jgi:hypothetical protein